jgi:hypothetical protein
MVRRESSTLHRRAQSGSGGLEGSEGWAGGYLTYLLERSSCCVGLDGGWLEW